MAPSDTALDELTDFEQDVIEYLHGNGEDRVADWLKAATKDPATYGPEEIAREEALDKSNVPACAEVIADRVHTHFEISPDYETGDGTEGDC